MYQLAPPKSDSPKVRELYDNYCILLNNFMHFQDILNTKKNKHCLVTKIPRDQSHKSSSLIENVISMQPTCSYKLSSNSKTLTQPIVTSHINPIASMDPLPSIELQSTTTRAETIIAEKPTEIEHHIADDQQIHEQVLNIVEGIQPQKEHQQQSNEVNS